MAALNETLNERATPFWYLKRQGLSSWGSSLPYKVFLSSPSPLQQPTPPTTNYKLEQLKCGKLGESKRLFKSIKLAEENLCLLLARCKLVAKVIS